MRADRRTNEQIRPLSLELGFIRNAEGSCLITQGNTRVICTASVERGVPPFLSGSARGWMTAEYGMLPRSTHTRSQRRVGDGRAQEIQRLIGRSLRAVAQLERLEGWTVQIDCDVIQADGGTRTASISGAYAAAMQAFAAMIKRGELAELPFREAVAAVSAGVVNGECMVDLCYSEDSSAEVDMNFVMTQGGEFVEVQGTAENRTFGKPVLDRLTQMAWQSISEILAAQRAALSAAGIGA